MLSYVIPRRIGESDARSLVRFGLPAGRIAAHVAPGILHMVPYYRVTAEEIRWQNGDEEGPPEEDEGLRFTSRVIEKNFVARETGVLPPSLGVRAQALELRLFDREALPPDVVVVSPDLTPRLARARALDDTADVHARALLRVVLQIVYFPFWMSTVSGDGAPRVAVVDAVAGALICGDVEPESVDRLARGVPRRSRSVGFRPLACPNCGWDLPLRKDDVLFQCSSCERGWLARADRLDPVSFSVTATTGPPPDRHLPVWQLSGGHGEAPIFAPAFRCRRLKALLHVGARLTRAGLSLERAEHIPRDLVGCALDEEDARAFARFVAAGIAFEAAAGASRPDLPAHVESLSAELLWLPFRSDGYALREPVTGTPVPSRLLDLDLADPRK